MSNLEQELVRSIAPFLSKPAPKSAPNLTHRAALTIDQSAVSDRELREAINSGRVFVHPDSGQYCYEVKTYNRGGLLFHKGYSIYADEVLDVWVVSHECGARVTSSTSESRFISSLWEAKITKKQFWNFFCELSDRDWSELDPINDQEVNTELLKWLNRCRNVALK